MESLHESELHSSEHMTCELLSQNFTSLSCWGPLTLYNSIYFILTREFFQPKFRGNSFLSTAKICARPNSEIRSCWVKYIKDIKVELLLKGNWLNFDETNLVGNWFWMNTNNKLALFDTIMNIDWQKPIPLMSRRIYAPVTPPRASSVHMAGVIILLELRTTALCKEHVRVKNLLKTK